VKEIVSSSYERRNKERNDCFKMLESTVSSKTDKDAAKISSKLWKAEDL
jgi:hypothetical protein